MDYWRVIENITLKLWFLIALELISWKFSLHGLIVRSCFNVAGLIRLFLQETTK
jgi:hypothetical protein